MPELARTPKLPGDSVENSRRESARLRLRLLNGDWFDDLLAHLAQHFDPVRERVIGRPDYSTNLFESVINQLSVLYDRPPVLRHEDEVGAARASDLLTSAGWWALGTQLQRFTLGCREAFVRPALVRDGTALLLRVVTPDCVSAEADPQEPDLPIRFTEARVRTVGGEDVWCHDRLDISDPDAPTYVVIREHDGADVTAEVLGTTGWPAELRDSSGAPVMPYATYHAKRTGQLWNWRTGSEVADGTLTVAVLWTWWLHNFRDASWAQRWTLDASVRGSSLVGAGKSQAATVTTDPSSVMQFSSDGDRAAIGQWNPSIDPLTLGTALAEFEGRLLVHFGLSPGDVQRTEGSAQSGYSITLQRTAVREQQRRYAPQFERGDQHLLRVVSALTRGTPQAIPEDGWSISYPGPPKSWNEIEADLAKNERLVAAGLASKVDAYMDHHPGVTREQALVELKRIADENRALG